MKKITSLAAVLLFFAICIQAQSHLPHSYTMVHKKMELKNNKPKYESVITYPQIENPVLASEKGFNDFIKAKMKAESETFEGSMKTWKTPKELKGTASYYDIGDSVLYRDSRMISVHFYGDSYFTGAAHPNNWSFSINYDLEKNREIKLSDLFTGDYIRLISDYCINDITKQKKENYDPDIAAPDDNTLQGAGAKEENFKVFNPTKDGFLITFPTYQVGAYVEGPMDVLMPYSELKNVIKGDGLLSDFVK